MLPLQTRPSSLRQLVCIEYMDSIRDACADADAARYAGMVHIFPVSRISDRTDKCGRGAAGGDGRFVSFVSACLARFGSGCFLTQVSYSGGLDLI